MSESIPLTVIGSSASPTALNHTICHGHWDELRLSLSAVIFIHTPASRPRLGSFACNRNYARTPPLSAFPRVNGKGQTIARATKSAQKKRTSAISTLVTVSHKIPQEEQHQIAATTLQAVPINVDTFLKEEASEDSVELQENSIARKRARLSRQPSVPTPLPTRASSRQLRNSPLTADGDSVTPEGVAPSQRVVTAPITDRELLPQRRLAQEHSSRPDPDPDVPEARSHMGLPHQARPPLPPHQFRSPHVTPDPTPTPWWA
ncbi:hypothetical protein RHS01_01986 [Rhizoctonia solani]|uniref:Uncharacterized protein n=1 Tax=Rhizoctonia solani TaxID=456999 RepID=A0A8H7M871_9AGAM|nr:hypothetical protein RHS01_01986 [Rhizoctonia solani]